MKSTDRYRIADMSSLPAIDCPCGKTSRAFTEDPDQTASLHWVEVSNDARLHYHKKMTEIYYILEGQGQLELDGELIAVHPGMAVMIKPFCRHRAIGKLKILNIPIPAFDPEDEWFDG